jgi:undecaprenyl-phosphate 4-deoxy-4-formamido-L-arabinose transferase
MTEGPTRLEAGISVVIPVYRSAESLPHLLPRLRTAMVALGQPFEILLVDDGSPDDSARVATEHFATIPELQLISLWRNFGQHPALMAGIRAARYAVTVTIDDDLQHRPEEIHLLVDGLTPDVDLVYGRPAEGEHGFWRNVSSRIVKGSLAAAVGNEVASQASAFRMFRTQLRDAFADTRDPFVSIDVLLSWATTSVTSVEVAMDQRPIGESNYTFRKLVRHAMNMLTGFSVVPLRIVTIVGFAFSLLGVGILGYVLIRYIIEGDPFPGFPFLASIIAIFSGVQLFALGVLGEYLGRVHFRSMQRPPYVVRERKAARPVSRSTTDGVPSARDQITPASRSSTPAR